jgi:hypothetical protein
VARAANLTEEPVSLVWRDFAAKRMETRYLHEPPLLIDGNTDAAGGEGLPDALSA